jgi:hypothetical protein
MAPRGNEVTVGVEVAVEVGVGVGVAVAVAPHFAFGCARSYTSASRFQSTCV